MNTKKNLLLIAHHFIPYSPSYGQCARQNSMAQHFIKHYNVFVIAAKRKDKFGDFGININKNVIVNYIYDKNSYPNYLKPLQGNNKKEKIKYALKNYGLWKTILRGISKYKSLFTLDRYEFSFPNKAYKLALNVVQNNNIDVIIVTVPPYSVVKIIPKLKKRFPNVKIILDFQDSWVVPALLNNKTISSYRARKIEKKSVAAADMVVFIGDVMKEHYDKHYKIEHKTKVFMNGFDRWDNIQNHNLNKKEEITSNIVRIGYFGKIHIGNQDYFRDVRKIFDFFKESDDNFKQKFHIDIFGPFSGNYKTWKQYVPFTYKGIVDHNEVYDRMIDYDFLLLFHSTKSRAEEVLTGKVFEYLSVNKPVIIIGTENMIDARNLIEKNNLGVFINIDDNADMFNKLNYIYDLKNSNKLKNSFNTNFDISQFDRESINNKYMLEIKEILLK